MSGSPGQENTGTTLFFSLILSNTLFPMLIAKLEIIFIQMKCFFNQQENNFMNVSLFIIAYNNCLSHEIILRHLYLKNGIVNNELKYLRD